MKNLLVTGGAGFIGSHFVRAVLADTLEPLEGARVTVVDSLAYAGGFANLGPVAEDRRLEFIPGDVTDAALIDSVLPGHDAIVHLAANVLGTQVLLDAAVRHGTGRFLQVSTGEVYDPATGEAAGPDSPLAPATPYGASKAAADLLALAAQRTHGLPVVVTRAASTYGPYQHPDRLIPRTLTDALRGRTVPPPRNGHRLREWLHVDDHCRALALALTDGKAGEVYPIGGTVELSDHQLTGVLLEACGHPWDQAADDPAEGLRYALDDERTRRELVYRPRVEFDAGLAATVRWYRDHEEWWRNAVTD